MRSDPKTRAFEICLERMISGTSLEQVLEDYPEFKDDLRPRLEAAQALRWLSTTTPDSAAAQASSKERFLLAISTVQRLDARKRVRSAKQMGQSHANAWGNLRFILAILTLVIFLCLGAVRTYGVSASALPGEPLYPIKLLSENFSLWIERNPAQKFNLEKSFDAKRIAEITSLQEKTEIGDTSPTVKLNFAGALLKSTSDNWLVDGIRVIVVPDTELVGQLENGYVVVVTGELQKDGQVIARRIESRQYPLSGKLIQLGDNLYQVSGVPFRLTPRTVVDGSILPCAQVEVVLFELASGDFEARLIEVKESAEITKTGDDLKPAQTVESTLEETREFDNRNHQTPTPTKEPSESEEENDESTHQPTSQPTEKDGDDEESRQTQKPNEDSKEPTRTPKPTEDD